jgi:hypothetical protein
LVGRVAQKSDQWRDLVIKIINEVYYLLRYGLHGVISQKIEPSVTDVRIPYLKAMKTRVP